MRLFPEFQAPSWAPWRNVLAAVDGLAPEDPEFVLRVTGRTTLPSRAVLEAAFGLGRGVGKSRMSGLKAAHALTARSYRRAPGEEIYVVVYGPDRRQSALTQRYASGLLHSHPVLEAMIANETK